MDAYVAFLRTQTFKTKPEQHHRDVCSSGTGSPSSPRAAAGDDPQLSQGLFAALGCAAGPFRDEAEAWLTSMSQEADLLNETGPIRPHRPASIKSYRYAMRQAVAGLQHSGRPLETIASLAALVEPDAATAALQFHLDRNGGRPSQMVAQIANVLVLVAQHAVGADAAVLAKLKRYRARLSPKRAGLRPRPRKALRQFVDRTNIEKLLVLPHRIYARLHAQA